jgi:nitric oxide reductase subunit C
MRVRLLGVVAAWALASCGPTPAATPTPDPLVVAGQGVFAARCAACHALTPDTVIVGPSLAGIAARAEGRVEGLDGEAYLRQSIAQPSAYVVEGFQNAMPQDLAKQLTSDELDAVVAFLLTQQ